MLNLGLLIIFIGLIAPAQSWSKESEFAELVMTYRTMTGNYITPPKTLNAVFSSFERLQEHSHLTLQALHDDVNFLQSMHDFSVSVNLLLETLPTNLSKQESLESLISVLTEKYSNTSEAPNLAVQQFYQAHLESTLKKILRNTMASKETPEITNLISFKGIKIKGNDVLKAVGSGGLYGFWLVTASVTLVSLYPNVQNYIYLPAIALLFAAAPNSVSNQIWLQVFDRIEKKAALKHQTAMEYLKERVRSVKYVRIFSRVDKKVLACLKSYKN